MTSASTRARLVAWASYIILLLQQALEAWTRQAPWIVWLALLAPLLIFVPGLVRDRLRTYIWLCFVLLLYFMRLVVALFAQPADPLYIIGMVAVVALFTSSMLYVRWRSRQLREAAIAASGHGE